MKSIVGIAALFVAVGDMNPYATSQQAPVSIGQAGPELTFDAAIAAAKESMNANPERALGLAQGAEEHGAASGDDRALAIWLQAEALTRLRRSEEALVLVSRARRVGTGSDQRLAAELLLTEANALTRLDHGGLALSSYQEAHTIFDALGDRRKVALTLHGIARLYEWARRWDRALDYYARASAAYPDDTILAYAAANNTAKILKDKGAIDQAVAAFEANVEKAEAIGSPYFVAIANGLLAEALAVRGDAAAADEAVERAKAFDDDPSSRTWKDFVSITEAFVAHEAGDDARAGRLLSELFADYDFDEPSRVYRSAHAAAVEHYAASGDFERALRHQVALSAVDDRSAQIAAKNNFDLLNAEFDDANKTIEIERLERERLEAEVAASAARDRMRNILTATILVAAALTLGLLLLYLRSVARGRARLARTNAELIAASEAKTKFLASTSHEIRTPLNAIIGFCEVLVTKDMIKGDARDMVDTIWTSGKDLLSIVNDILDVAKMEGGKMTVEPAPADLTETFEHVAALHRINAEKKGVMLSLKVEDGLPCYVTDEHRIRQAVGNLVGNAVKFTDEGRIDIGVRAVPSGGFEVSVADTGIGIPADQVHKVFESFSQVDGQKQARYGGTGLGLALVKHVAELLGGDVRVESVKGAGSTFTLRIPAETADPADCEAEPAPVAAEPAAIAPRNLPRLPSGEIDLTKLRVLYAEDNAVNVMVLKGMIGDAVGRIDIAEDGAIALRRLMQEPYDLVLMDNQMPMMNGLEATKVIRETEGISEIPVIGVTADAVPAIKAALREAGMDAVVDKPVTRQTLLNALTDVLGGRPPTKAEVSA